MPELNILEAANFVRDYLRERKAKKYLTNNPTQLQSIQGVQGVPSELLANPYMQSALRQAVEGFTQGAGIGLTKAQTEAIPAATKLQGERTEADLLSALPFILQTTTFGLPQEDQSAVASEALRAFSPTGPAGRVAGAVGKGMESSAARGKAISDAVLGLQTGGAGGPPAASGMLPTDVAPRGTTPPPGLLIGQPQGQGPAKGYQFPSLTPPPPPTTYPSGNLKPNAPFSISPDGRITFGNSATPPNLAQPPSGPLTEQQLMDLIAQGEQVQRSYEHPGLVGTFDYIMELLGLGKEQRAKNRAVEEEALRRAEKARSLLEVTRKQKR